MEEKKIVTNALWRLSGILLDSGLTRGVNLVSLGTVLDIAE